MVGKTKTRAPEKRKQQRFSIHFQVFCYSVNLWSWEDIVHHTFSSTSKPLLALPSFYSVFHINCQFAVLWKEQRCFLLTLLFSLSLLEKVCCEKSWLLDGTQAAFRSPDLPVHLPLSLSFLHPFLASHTTPSSSIHLISSNWWRYIIFFFFPSPCCWVLSLLLCPTKGLITALLWKCFFVNCWGTGRERDRGKESEKERI